jgi:hypothetical protein
MSDYGDDFSDYGDEWLYIEDEYMAADDLAEHAIASPPPTAYGDDDMHADWDRFDYYNDIEYASDGYDDAAFQLHGTEGAKIGQKRKRVATHSRSNKKQRVAAEAPHTVVVAPSPVVWRSQKDRAPKQKLLADDAPSYALLKNWREELVETPRWACASPPAESPGSQAGGMPPAIAAALHAMISQTNDDDDTLAEGEEMEEEEEDDDDEEGETDGDISQDALMAALQRQLAAAGGPLGGMDPQQLLQFAMRMATDKDGADGIIDEMLEGKDEEQLLELAKGMGVEGVEDDEVEDMADAGEAEDDNEEGTEEDAHSRPPVLQAMNKDLIAPEPKSPEDARVSGRPPTPPSSETNRSVKAAASTKSDGTKSKSWTATETKPVAPLKRKAEVEDEAESSTRTTKKRATRSFDAPTAASQAKAATTRATRSTRPKR